MSEHFDLLIRHRTPDQVRVAARTKRGNVFLGGLHLRVRGDRITATYGVGKYSTPPRLRGRLESSSEGTRIVGRLRWWGAKFFVAVFWCAGVLMVGLAVLAGTSGGGAAVVLACSVTAFVFALIAATMMITNEIGKGRDRAQLSQELRRALEV